MCMTKDITCIVTFVSLRYITDTGHTNTYAKNVIYEEHNPKRYQRFMMIIMQEGVMKSVWNKVTWVGRKFMKISSYGESIVDK